MEKEETHPSSFLWISTGKIPTSPLIFLGIEEHGSIVPHPIRHHGLVLMRGDSLMFRHGGLLVDHGGPETKKRFLVPTEALHHIVNLADGR